MNAGVKIFLYSIIAMVSIGLFLFTGPAVQAAPKGEITYVSFTGTWEIRTAFDPHTAIGASGVTLIDLVFDGLVTKDSEGVFQPALAESWAIGEKWSHLDFFLRRGVTFHNGDPFSARDVKFSIERAMREDMRFIFGAELRRQIDSVEIIDDYHVRIHLKAPYPAFFDRTYEYLAIVPKDYIEKVGDAGFAAKPVGAGPFKVVKFSRDLFFEVEAVENHYRKTPYVKKLTARFVAEESTRLAMLMTGEADLIGLAAAHVPRVNRDPNLRVVWSRDAYLTTLFFFDVSHPEESPFKDPRVRKAASLAIDREGIAEALTHGGSTAWGSFLAPYHAGFDSGRKPDPYDPAQARKLLAEAGYPDGFDTVLISNPPTRDRFEAIQQQLADVGIRARLEVPEHGTWASTYVAGNHRGLGCGSGPWWSSRPHPYVALESYIIGTWSHNLETPEVLQAMERILHAIDEYSIAAAAREADETLLTQMHGAPLWSTHMPLGAGPRIKELASPPGVVFPMGFEHLKIRD
jgi:peptide/nickel transport system substrate-binding protein